MAAVRDRQRAVLCLLGHRAGQAAQVGSQHGGWCGRKLQGSSKTSVPKCVLAHPYLQIKSIYPLAIIHVLGNGGFGYDPGSLIGRIVLWIMIFEFELQHPSLVMNDYLIMLCSADQCEPGACRRLLHAYSQGDFIETERSMCHCLGRTAYAAHVWHAFLLLCWHPACLTHVLMFFAGC